MYKQICRPNSTQPFYGPVDSVLDNPGEPVPEGTVLHLLDFLEQNEDNTGIIFMQDALPYTTLPIYPALGQAPNMLACITGGLIA